MAKRLIIHIGAPKTGSTALQKFLFDSRLELEKEGLLYPDVSLRGFGHHDLAFLVGGGYPDWATSQDKSLEELTSDLSKKTSRHNGTIILSSEDFYLFPAPEKLKEVLVAANIYTESDTKIIMYLRRQDEAHESWYNQRIKAQGYTGTIEDSIEDSKELWDYKKNVGLWADTFGAENLVLRTYQDGNLINNDIIADFFHTFDINANIGESTSLNYNLRINRDILEFQRTINKLPLSYVEKRTFHKDLIDLTNSNPTTCAFDDTPLINSHKRRSLLLEYSSTNKYIANSYFKRDNLFNDFFSRDDKDSTEYKGLSTDKMILIAGWLLAKRCK